MGRPIGKRKCDTPEQALGAVITGLRLTKRLNYQEVAAKVGCNDACLHRVESGKTNPSFRLLKAIADYHGIRLSLLLRMAEDKHSRGRR